MINKSFQHLHNSIHRGEGEHNVANGVDDGDAEDGPELAQEGVGEYGAQDGRKVACHGKDVKSLSGGVFTVEENVAEKKHQNG